MCRPALRLRRRFRRLATVTRTGLSNRSRVAALAANRRSLISGIQVQMSVSFHGLYQVG